MNSIFALFLLAGIAAEAKPYICKEGQQAVFEEAVEGTDRYNRILRTCVNGSYWEKAKPVVQTSRCQEGEVVVFEEYIPGTDYYKRVPRTCTNGRFYPKAPAVVPMKCKEGQITLVRLQRQNTDYMEHQVCKNGKWKKLY